MNSVLIFKSIPVDDDSVNSDDVGSEGNIVSKESSNSPNDSLILY